MAVDFVIRASDLRRATKHLKVNREKHVETDSTDILVSQCIATFRAVGMETEVPVQGRQPGTVRIPLKVWMAIESVAQSFKVKDIPFSCEHGRVRIGSWSAKHPDIETGIIPDRRVSVPADISVLDTLALAQVLTPEQLIECDLRARVEAAEQERSRSIATAMAALEPLGLTEPQLQKLIDASVADATVRLQRTLGITS